MVIQYNFVHAWHYVTISTAYFSVRGWNHTASKAKAIIDAAYLLRLGDKCKLRVMP